MPDLFIIEIKSKADLIEDGSDEYSAEYHGGCTLPNMFLITDGSFTGCYQGDDQHGLGSIFIPSEIQTITKQES